jgi:hypothetical protein
MPDISVACNRAGLYSDESDLHLGGHSFEFWVQLYLMTLCHGLHLYFIFISIIIYTKYETLNLR